MLLAKPTEFSKNITNFVRRSGGFEAVGDMTEAVLSKNIAKFMSDAGDSLAKRQFYIDSVKEIVAEALQKNIEDIWPRPKITASSFVQGGVLKDDMHHAFETLRMYYVRNASPLDDVSFSEFIYGHFSGMQYSPILDVLNRQFEAGVLGQSDMEITRNVRSLLKESFMRVAPAEDSIAFSDLMNTWIKDNLNLIKDPLSVSRGYLPPSAAEQPVSSGASNVIQDTSSHVPPDEVVRSKVFVPPEIGRVDADLPAGIAPRLIPQAVDEVDRGVYGGNEYAQVGSGKFKQMLNVLMTKYHSGDLDNVQSTDNIRTVQIAAELRNVGVDDIKTGLVEAYLKAMRAENGGYLGMKRPPPAVRSDKALVVIEPLPAQRLEGANPAVALDGANVTPTLEIKPVAVLQR